MGCSVSVEVEAKPKKSSASPKPNASSAGSSGRKAAADGAPKGDKSQRKDTGDSKPVAAATAASAKQNSNAASAAAAAGSDAPAAPRPPRKMRLKEIKAATNNFNERNVLGEGSFGKVYKGSLQESGEALNIAVKKLNPDSFQGFDEWIAEVLTLEKVQHPYLVNLVGYSSEGGESILVYELCDGGSLDDVLFASDKNSPLLSWPDRVRIAQECGQALAHLHDHRIIHRDLKPSNILLTKEYSTRLTDFGLAKETADGQSHVSTRVMGTMGYLDPSYLETGKLRDQSDVYSYGVILLELITGKRAMTDEGESLTQWIRPFLTQKKPDLKLIVDPRLGQDYSKAGAVKLVIVAKHCLNPNFDLRPRMKTVVENLKLVDLD